MAIISLNLQAPVREKRDVLEQAGVSLSAGLMSLGMGTFTDSNENVTEHTAPQVPTVMACLQQLSAGISGMPLRVYEELDRGRKPAKGHYLWYMLTQRPNPDMSAKVFMSTMMVHAALWQNAYAEIERDGGGRPMALWPRAPWRTKPDRVNGRLVFKTTDTTNRQERVIDAKNMIHIVGMTLDGLAGSSLISYMRQSIGLSMVAARFGARFFANGARPGFFLQPEAPLSPEDMTLLRQDVELMSSGGNAWRVAALPSGVKVVEVTTDPNALAEYVNTRKFEREEIAAAFGVPAYKVGAAEKTLKSTIEQQSQDWLVSLLPWIEGFQQEFQYKLLPPVGRASGKYTILFYKEAMATIDTATKTAKYTAGRTGGWFTVNNILELEDVEPIGPKGDVYLTPLNMTDAAQVATDLETVDEPEAVEDVEPVKASRAKELYGPIFTDAFTRLQHRSKRDLASITQTLSPAISSLGMYFRSSSTTGTAEAQAVEKYFKGLEGRATNLTAEAAASELDRAMKAIVFSIEQDAAEARAKEKLNG